MSVKVLTYVLEHSTQRGNELLTLIVLADHANEQGFCWPSIDRLGRLIRADARTARRCIRRLEKTGELKVRKGDGPGGTNMYWITMQETLELFAQPTGDSPPGKLPPRTPKAIPPDTAVSAEPSRTVIKSKSVPGQGKPSPVSACWQVYLQGIKAAYGADYPPSAQANGQLNNVVKKLGSGPAIQVVAHYLANKKPYYVARKHALEVLVRDCATLWLECQQVTGGRAAQPCAYCPAAAIGSVNGIEHCRAHQNDAMDAKRVAA